MTINDFLNVANVWSSRQEKKKTSKYFGANSARNEHSTVAWPENREFQNLMTHFLRLYENQNHLPKIHCHLTRLLRLNVNFTFVQLKRRSYVFTTRTERACQIENNWRKTTTNVLMNLPGIVLFSFRKQLLLFTYAKCIRENWTCFKYHSVQNPFHFCF